ncbi:Cu2+-exporting ATPase [Desulfobotulus alkaliphilus]|uniref:P-type Zn(2+) transporter n=1 Tax=Desulfobotulus alkaliphilus TaxID=622671 RepID=A0A562S2P3_9BACT|nr:heavy metal translocating P-type ATPase [Desulfobotulus alkaliphilus]TWI75671.1 Cu2+-exporting ATPase [Desulfobotulus alkaliphilus]
MTRIRYMPDNPSVQVVHSIPGRFRVKSRTFTNPALDPDYVTAFIAALPGVLQVRMNTGSGSIVVEHDPGADVRDEILLRLQNLPNEAFLPEVSQRSGPDLFEVGTRTFAAAITPFLPRSLQGPFSWALSIPTLVGGAETLVTEGLKVEVLDASVRLMSLARKNYFVGNAVGAMLSMAAYFEESSTRQANDLLKNLLRPQADRLRVERDGTEVLIDSDQAMVGDIVICGPGEMIPVDGLVISGEASVNACSITGESSPVHAMPGSEVLSGGIIEEGRLRVEALNVGKETSMARIGKFLEKSLRTQSGHQRWSHTLADRLVPLTFGVGLGVYALTGSAARAASVLAVDYSCAIKLATPVAVRTAMYHAGKNGVLLKGAQALEALGSVDTLIFDKTGTLTHGLLELTDILPLEDFTEDEVLALAAGAEEHYGHPVARAVLKAARERNLSLPPISQVDFIVAHGVSAYVDDKRVLVGSRHFIEEDEGISCAEVDGEAEILQDGGKTLLYLALEGRLVALMALRDTLRSEAGATLKALKASGFSHLVMLSGDQPRPVHAVADQLKELDEVHAGLKPEDKARIVARLKEEGRKVAFVGDGVNDSPALLSADVGICMSEGADLARDAAQVVLMKDDLDGLVLARSIARDTSKVLHNALWSAVGINSTLLVLAGTGRISTLTSAALHNASTIGILAYAAMNKGEQDALPS